MLWFFPIWVIIMFKTLAVIPARWKSKRFPGKPIVPLLGIPMIVRVWRQVMRASLVDRCLLATDDEKIAKVAHDNQMEVIMTSDKCRTGTDRVAEVAEEVDADIYVNVQGDEPLVEPADIDRIIMGHKRFIERDIEVTNAYVPEDALPFEDKSVHAFLIKTVDDLVMGLSRHPIPYFFKSEVIRNAHLGMYAFSQEALRTFSMLEQGPIEKAESIEMLRYSEHSIPMGCVCLSSGSKTVDYPEDVEEVEKILRTLEKKS